jgi:hypothetical protein
MGNLNILVPSGPTPVSLGPNAVLGCVNLGLPEGKLDKAPKVG